MLYSIIVAFLAVAGAVPAGIALDAKLSKLEAAFAADVHMKEGWCYGPSFSQAWCAYGVSCTRGSNTRARMMPLEHSARARVAALPHALRSPLALDAWRRLSRVRFACVQLCPARCSDGKTVAKEEEEQMWSVIKAEVEKKEGFCYGPSFSQLWCAHGVSRARPEPARNIWLHALYRHFATRIAHALLAWLAGLCRVRAALRSPVQRRQDDQQD
jgi:hypothetical protein